MVTTKNYTQNKLNELAQNFLISQICIDKEDTGNLPVPETLPEKLLFILKKFESEKFHLRQQYEFKNELFCFTDWLDGAPGILEIATMQHKDIENMLWLWNIPEDMWESYYGTWSRFMAQTFFQLCRKYQIC